MSLKVLSLVLILLAPQVMAETFIGRTVGITDGRDPGAQVDDVGYLAALIARLVADGRIDPSQVFVAGHSNGDGMAMRLACDRPDLIAGIAVVATKAPTNYNCRQGRSVPAIFFYGTADPAAPPQGRPQSDRLGGTLSADATLALWSERNGCGGPRLAKNLDSHHDGTSAQIFQYRNCRAPLVYVLIAGHGHAWPGAGSRLSGLQGPATQEVDAAELAWWFFSLR
ncbi:MAG: PHB depolymerase family esterase [Roseobacter sp.]